MFIAEPADALQKFFRRRIDAALALNGLQNHRTGVVMDQRLNAVQIVEIREADSRQQRLERLLIVLVAGHRQRSQASAVEGVLHGDDLMAAVSVPAEAVFFRDFQRPFYGFRTAVGKKYPIHARRLQKLFSGVDHRLIVKQVGGMQQLFRLRLYRLRVFRISVPQGAHGNAGAEVQVLRSLRVVQVHAFSVVKHHREPVIGFVQHLLRPAHGRFRLILHDNTAPLWN